MENSDPLCVCTLTKGKGARTERTHQMHGVHLHESSRKSRIRSRRVVMRPLPGRAFLRETAAIQSALDRRKRNGHPCPQELLMHDLSAPVPLQTFLDDLPDNSLRQSQGTPLRTGALRRDRSGIEMPGLLLPTYDRRLIVAEVTGYFPTAFPFTEHLDRLPPYLGDMRIHRICHSFAC